MQHLTECLRELQGELTGKRVMITGAAGLIGSTVVRLLLAANHELGMGVEIIAHEFRREFLEQRFADCADELTFVEGDVSTLALPDVEVDYIIHAASPAHPLAYSQTPVDVMRANLLGTMNMLEIAKRCGARLLFISSGEIYGISEDPESAFKENEYGYVDILNPRSCYPESKRAAETLCASYHAQYGVEALVTRLCHVYGPSITATNTRADAQFLRNALNGEDIVMKSPGTQVRSFCYVKDCALGLIYIMVRGAAGEAYNVANRHSIATIRQYAETLADLAGVSIRNEFPSEEEARGYTKVTRAVLDGSKLEQLGWMPQYDLKAGLGDMLNTLRKKTLIGRQQKVGHHG